MSTLIQEVQARRRLPKPSTCRAIREEAQVTQERLAAEIGVDRMSLSKWERGVARPRAAAAARWSDLLDQLREAAS